MTSDSGTEEKAAIATRFGTLVLRRHGVLQTFQCGRCHDVKTSKLMATWTTAEGVDVTICNGCYGSLVAPGALR